MCARETDTAEQEEKKNKSVFCTQHASCIVLPRCLTATRPRRESIVIARDGRFRDFFFLFFRPSLRNARDWYTETRGTSYEYHTFDIRLKRFPTFGSFGAFVDFPVDTRRRRVFVYSADRRVESRSPGGREGGGFTRLYCGPRENAYGGGPKIVFSRARSRRPRPKSLFGPKNKRLRRHRALAVVGDCDR